ncbi:TonB-dependent receptor domain-containing protein [Phenylobacterium sp.]|uniref:TonB-dependent receptor domain-containing protein n=1 Tax=Phenylobacterium sp. TaxID=1871053 RepID=UPI003566E488
MKDYQVSALALLAALTPFAALAQTASTPAVEVQEVIVTGSHIARQDYSASTPVVTIGAAAVQKTGSVTLDTVLKEQPQFVASTGSTTNSSGNGGQANIQLRGLGRARTLVLMDGRRLPPANSDGSVDINAIPTSLIENVEIITGGASAVYGSDAIAGVVNIRMKHHFDGLEVSAQYGIAGHGDAEDYKIGVAGGGDFDSGRGSSVFSLEYSNRNPIYYADRSFTAGSQRDSVLPQGLVSFASGTPTQAALDAVFGKYGVAPGVVKAGNQFGFNANGSLFSTGLSVQNYKGSTDPTLFAIGPTAVLAEGRQYRYLQLPLETYSVFNRTSFDLDENNHLFGQFSYTNSVGATQLNPVPGPSNATTGVPLIPVTNPFIPADLKTLLASRANPTAPIALSKRFDVFGPRLQENHNDTFQVVIGANGKLPISDWTYDAYGSYGKNSILIERPVWQSHAALQTLLSAPDGGASICAGGFNPFGQQAVSAACGAFINKHLQSTAEIEQRVVEASAQGGLFDLPAGRVRFAAGADYREDYFNSQADPLIIAGDIIAGNGSSFVGSTNVKEGYLELLVPMLKDLPFAKDVSADLGYRYSDYSSVGGVKTYKADVNWQVVDAFTFRGGYERAIRAPSIGELDAPVVNGTTIIGLAGSIGSGDPCDVRGAYRTGANGAKVRALCLATGVPSSIIDTFTFAQQSVGNISGGNPNLHQETADTFSVGAVWRPRFAAPLFSNLSVSLDYYNIDLKDAVGSITAPLVLSRCFNASGVTNPNYDASNVFCGRVTRNSDGSINLVSQQSLNLGGYKTAGYDLQADWRFETSAIGLNDGGDLNINLLTNYLDNFLIKSLPGDPFLQFAGTIGNGQIDPVAIARPRWKSNLDASYSRGPMNLGVTWRYIGKMSNAANVGTPGTAAGVPAVSYVDLTGRYKLTEKVELWGVIANVADKHPPVYPAVGSTDLATYDAVGRRFILGVKARF